MLYKKDVLNWKEPLGSSLTTAAARGLRHANHSQNYSEFMVAEYTIGVDSLSAGNSG